MGEKNRFVCLPAVVDKLTPSGSSDSDTPATKKKSSFSILQHILQAEADLSVFSLPIVANQNFIRWP